MRRLAVALAAACAAAAATAGSAGATNECRGLPVCVPVAGPWVLTPGQAETQYQLSCPKGFVVAGLDAELTTRLIDLVFRGTLGTPVNPGITTSDSAVFLGRLARGRDVAASFRPHIGCIPTSGGGGQRVPTAVRVDPSARVYPPGSPTVRRVTEIAARAGAIRRVVRACGPGEQLVSASHAIGFYTPSPPGRALAAAVVVTQAVEAGHVSVAVHAGAPAASVRAVVQLDLVCAGSTG